jgi:hypothetical protein
MDPGTGGEGGWSVQDLHHQALRNSMSHTDYMGDHSNLPGKLMSIPAVEPCGTSRDGVDDSENGGGDDGRQEDEDEDENSSENGFKYEKCGHFLQPPSIAEAEVGLEAIKVILKPPRKNGPGSEHHGLDELAHSCLEAMKKLLWKYICGVQTTGWIWASLDVA